jgi:hypothetical protein
MAGKLIDIIAQVDDGRHDRRGEDPWGIMVHRCGIDHQTGVVFGYDGKGVADAFAGRVAMWQAAARATGSEVPYTILIGGDNGPPEFDGAAWHCLPLDETGPHGRRFSSGFIGVGLIADPRYKPLSYRQRDKLIDVCAALCDGYGWDPADRLRGHGEVRGSHDGSKRPGQPAACPGDLLSMGTLRDEVAEMLQRQRRGRLALQMSFTR